MMRSSLNSRIRLKCLTISQFCGSREAGQTSPRRAKESAGVIAAPVNHLRIGGEAFEAKERALVHKYRVGETVYFTASNVSRPASSGTYQVIRLLPTDGDDCQYRIKSSDEAFERVAKESQLSAS